MKRKRHVIHERSPTRWIPGALVLAAAVCFMIAGTDIRSSRTAKEEYDALLEQYTESAAQDADTWEEQTAQQEKKNQNSAAPGRDAKDSLPSIDHSGLLKINPDYVGWLCFEEGKISCPVVRDSDGSGKYLHQTFEGKRNPAGAVFIGEESDPDFTDLNTFLFGHNMRNGTMFGSLKYFAVHPPEGTSCFLIETKTGEKLCYRVFAAAVVSKGSDLFRVPLDGKACSQYLNEVRSRAFYYHSDALPQTQTSLVTLSTCNGAQGTSQRLLIFGALSERRQAPQQKNNSQKGQ